MQSDSAFEEMTTGFTLVCGGYRSAGSHAGASAGAGRLVFSIGPNLMAELDQDDLIESWAAADELSAQEAAEMTEEAALHLSELLEEGVSAVDLAEAVTDAAVVFLLAMKRHGISDPKRIPACSVKWNLATGREQICLGS
jgi:hypothetical protein